MNKDEQDLLNWLSMEEENPFGSCHGAALDRLILLGLAQLTPAASHAGYYCVSLTEAGYKRVDRAAVQAELNKRHP